MKLVPHYKCRLALSTKTNRGVGGFHPASSSASFRANQQVVFNEGSANQVLSASSEDKCAPSSARAALPTRRTRQSDNVIELNRMYAFNPVISLVYCLHCTVMACASLIGVPWVVDGATSLLITHCRATFCCSPLLLCQESWQVADLFCAIHSSPSKYSCFWVVEFVFLFFLFIFSSIARVLLYMLQSLWQFPLWRWFPGT